MNAIKVIKTLQFIILSATLCITVSCTNDFEEINTDPLRPSTANQGSMLGQVEYQMVNTTISSAKEFTHEVMQVTAPNLSISGGIHRYEIMPGTGVGTWRNLYARMTDLNDIIQKSAENEPNYRAIAITLRAWGYSILTDAFGPIPFSEAAQAPNGILTPKFDAQKDIYSELLKQLKEANSIIDTSQGLDYGGDGIYGDDAAAMMKWKKFINTLRLRLLLRVINRDSQVNAKAQINEILSDPVKYPVFTSNDDDAIFRYTGDYPYYNPYYNARTLDWRQGDYYTKFFIDPMIAHSDPRLERWARKVDVNGKPGYIGIESGYVPGTDHTVTDTKSSYNDELKTSPLLGVIMTYSELEFIKAELALRGFNTGETPHSHYEKGIIASMTQWGVKAGTNFLKQDGVHYDESATFDKQLEQIMLQKYYAYFFVDMQAWFEKNRTGYPVLPRGKGIPAENQFPSRLLYPTYLQSLNPDNLKAAVELLGGKDVSTVAPWWTGR